MPAPSTASDFLDLVRKSDVVDRKRLDDFLTTTPGVSEEPATLARQLLGAGLLTRFQTEQLLQGKWRGFHIGKYLILERLGSGGMGSVYLCEHKLMRRRVAIKVLTTAKAKDPSALERFYREARAVAALDHPNIVRAYDIDQQDSLHYLVMEYVNGSSLQQIVRKNGPLDPVRAAHYVAQAALGLQHAHEKARLVHRDIKPANLLVDRNGVVKILDMGLARFTFDADDILTRKYDETILGTADYFAPEQALDSHNVDIRADIYSLGSTLYFCLTGRAPFAEGSAVQKLIWHQTRQPRSVRSCNPEVPEELALVVEKMMVKDPALRYQTPREVAEVLAPWTRTPIAPPSPAEMPARLAAAAGASPSDTGIAIPGPTTASPLSSSFKKWQLPTSPRTEIHSSKTSTHLPRGTP